MPLTPPAAYGTQMQAALKQAATDAGIEAGSEVTDAQLAKLFEAMATVNNASLAGAEVAPGTFVAPPGMAGGPVTGIGGGIV